VGYRFESGGRVFAFATDTGTVTQEVYDCFKGANAAVIEANHDVEMLKNGPYPYYLKKRILSSSGHLSNKVSGKFAAAITNQGTEKIVLAHLSVYNNTPQLAYEAVAGALNGIGANIDKDVKLSVAPAYCNGEVYTV
jgi:phosphoribosyl 1,2-cyclic phosphodiesterase